MLSQQGPLLQRLAPHLQQRLLQCLVPSLLLQLLQRQAPHQQQQQLLLLRHLPHHLLPLMLHRQLLPTAAAAAAAGAGKVQGISAAPDGALGPAASQGWLYHWQAQPARPQSALRLLQS
jgi:hypothetical protein